MGGQRGDDGQAWRGGSKKKTWGCGGNHVSPVKERTEAASRVTGAEHGSEQHLVLPTLSAQPPLPAGPHLFVLLHGGVEFLGQVVGHIGHAGLLLVGAADAAFILVGFPCCSFSWRSCCRRLPCNKTHGCRPHPAPCSMLGRHQAASSGSARAQGAGLRQVTAKRTATCLLKGPRCLPHLQSKC